MTKRKNIVSIPSSKAGEQDKQYQKRRGKWIDLSTEKEVPANLIDMLETYLQLDDVEYREEKEKLPTFPSSSNVRDTNTIEKLTESVSKLTRVMESFIKSTNSSMVKKEKSVPSLEKIETPKQELDVKKGYEKVVSPSGQVNYKNTESGKFVKKEEATQVPSVLEMAKRTYGPQIKEFFAGSKNKYGEVTNPSLGRDYLERVLPISSMVFGARDAKRSVIGNELHNYESNIRENPKNKNLSQEEIDKMIEKKKNDLNNQKNKNSLFQNLDKPATATTNVLPQPTVVPTQKIDIRTLDRENPETQVKENRNVSPIEVNILSISNNVLQKLVDLLKNSHQEKQPENNAEPTGRSNFNPLDLLGGRKRNPPILDKNGKPLRGAALKSAERKAGAKAAEKAGAKVLGKSLLKKIPLVGAGAGLVFGAQRLMQGDYVGAGAEVLSGAASIVPGYGTAASIGIDAALGARDVANAYNTELEPPSDTTNLVKPPVTAQAQNVTMANKQNQAIRDTKMTSAHNAPVSVNNVNNSPSNIVNHNSISNLPTAGPRGSLDLSKFA